MIDNLGSNILCILYVAQTVYAAVQLFQHGVYTLRFIGCEPDNHHPTRCSEEMLWSDCIAEIVPPNKVPRTVCNSHCVHQASSFDAGADFIDILQQALLKLDCRFTFRPALQLQTDICTLFWRHKKIGSFVGQWRRFCTRD